MPPQCRSTAWPACRTGTAGSRDGAEHRNQAAHRSEQPDQGGDVGQRPQRADALLGLRLEFGQPLAECRIDLVRALVGVGEPGSNELQDRIVAGLAELDGAVDVPGCNKLADLRKELLRIDPVPGELEMKRSATIVSTTADTIRFSTMNVGLCLKAETNCPDCAPSAAKAEVAFPFSFPDAPLIGGRL